MTEWTVAYVMQQRSKSNEALILFANPVEPVEVIKNPMGRVERPERMFKSCMNCARIDQIGHC